MTDGTQQEEFFTATKLIARVKPSVVRGFVIVSLGHKDDILDVNSLTIADAREIADMLYAAATLAEAMQLEGKPVW